MNHVIKQDFSADAPIIDFVESVDHILSKLGISDSSYRNPSKQEDTSEKIAGLTNTYLKSTRIGRKIALGKVEFFYGLKFNLLPVVFETVPYDTPSDVCSFIQNRLKETLTGYLSVHKGHFRMDIDVREGVVTEFAKMGFDDQFTFLSKDKILTIGDLARIMNVLTE